jgi:capsular polysaccharide transport system ATP-binding protein
MIQLEDVTKHYKTRAGRRLILDKVQLTVRPGDKIGILGRNGSGKSTLIRLIGGSEQPTSGVITRTMNVSWPLAFAGGFQGSLTGLDNLRFICRVYDKSYSETLPFVEEFSELGAYLREPVKNYSSGMRARLAFAMSMAVEFDCFLIDEVISVGDARFHEKCRRELFEKRADRAMIMVSHELHNITEHCTRACVLDRGRLHEFADLDSAYHYYNAR